MFHFPGLIYVITTIVLVLGAINGQNNLLFIIFGLAVGGLIVSGILSGANLIGIHVDRVESRGGTGGEGAAAGVGEEATLRYAIRNRNRLFSSFALIIEELPPSVERGASRSARRLLSPAAAFAAHVPARTSGRGASGIIEVEAHPLALARGAARINRFRVVSTFPFGLTKKALIFECADEVLIHPAPATILRPVIGTGSGEKATGGAVRAWRGGDDFYSLREFASGDSVRSVAWRASARTGTMLVKDASVPRSRRVLIEFEPSPSDSAATERCLSAAAGLALDAMSKGYEVAIGERDGSMLMGFGPRGGTSGGGARANAMLSVLARWEHSEPANGKTPSQSQTPDNESRQGKNVLRVVVIAGGGTGGDDGTGSGIVCVGGDDAEVFAPASATLPPPPPSPPPRQPSLPASPHTGENP